MNFFLKIKHWQLFLILIGIPIIFQMAIAYMLLATHNPRIIFICMPVMMIAEVAVLFGWLYSMGVNLHKILPGGFKMNVTLFKIFTIIPLVYISVISVLLFGLFSNLDLDQDLKHIKPDPFKIMAIVATLIPIHLFSVFCIFYGFWFIGKALKTIEMKKEVKFEDYVGEFFLLWFFIVGVWIIQPRINKLFDESLQESKALDGNMM